MSKSLSFKESNHRVSEVRDEAQNDDIYNESVGLSLNAQKRAFLKSSTIKMKRLESLLLEGRLEQDFVEMSQLIGELDNYDLLNYRYEANAATLLHLLVNRELAPESLLLELFTKLVDKDCDINVADDYGWTVLHYCANYNYDTIAQFVLENKCLKDETVSIKSTRQQKLNALYFLIGTSAFQVCAWLNRLPIAQRLLKRGASPSDKNEAGWTSLHICARQGHLDFVNYLLKHGVNVNEGNDHQKTSLHVSCRHGNEKIAKALLKANANVSLKNNYGQSPLFVAVTRGHMRAVRLLLEYNSDPNQVDKQENNALHACAMLNEASHEDGSSKPKRTVEIAELLLSKGANPLKQNSLGFTPLHYCSKNNCVRLAALLVAQNSSILNVRNIYGETALYLACKWGSLDMEKLLLEKNANKDLADLAGLSPCHLCAYECLDQRLLSTLLESGDDVNKSTLNKSGDTPLHIASKSNYPRMVSFLISKDADVNKANRDKRTPLHLATAHGSIDACQLLLNAGAKVNKTDNGGETPLHSCIRAPSDSVRIAKLLIDYGTSMNQENGENQTAIVQATMSGNYELVEFLASKKARVINSTYESVAHLCATSNSCDPKCLRLLIETYGLADLFNYSLSHYRTPLQLCVERRSMTFLRCLIACENVTCREWCEQIHSKDGVGISPLVMAVSSQNYAFIQALIRMWFDKFHSTHHNINDSDDDDEHVHDLGEHFGERGLRKKMRQLANKLNQKIGASETPRLKRVKHGCLVCKSSQTCLFKPNWNDPNQASEKYYLNVLIRENTALTKEILNTFIQSDILKWKTYLYLDHVEPCEELDADTYNAYERPLTPLETIYLYNKPELATHPVVNKLIIEKYQDFARTAFWIFSIRNVLHLIIWTAFAVSENYSIRHYYNGANSAGKIVLIILTVLIFIWDVGEEIAQLYFCLRRVHGFKKWIKEKYENLKSLERMESVKLKSGDQGAADKMMTSSREERSSSFRAVMNRRKTEAMYSRKTNKYSLIKKEEKASLTLGMPYLKRVDNVMDWFAILLQFVSLLLHFIDIGAHTSQLARAQNIFVYISVIIIWLRQLLVVNGIFPGVDLVAMVRLIGPYISSFAFLYIRIYIPFILLFWALYSGSRIPQNVMDDNWRECEAVAYNLPYAGTLNSTYYSKVCEATVNVNGFENFYNSLYSVFRLIVVDNYDFDAMKRVQNEMAPILCSTFIILSSIIALNFFIGLMSNVLSDTAYNSVESHKCMELLGYVLQLEWRLSRQRRQKHLDRIRSECSPKVLSDKDTSKFNKIMSKKRSMLNSKESASSFGSDSSNTDTNRSVNNNSSSNNSTNMDKNDVNRLLEEIGDFRAELKAMKNLLKSHSKE